MNNSETPRSQSLRKHPLSDISPTKLNKLVISHSGGTAFEDAPNQGRVLVFGKDTGGQYGLMVYSLAPGSTDKPVGDRDFGPHLHGKLEETFLVQKGSLQFLLGPEVFTLNQGDFVRVPPGIRHGYVNISGAQVDLLVGFYPGGFEELFIKHRSDQSPAPDEDGFLNDSERLWDSVFEGRGRT